MNEEKGLSVMKSPFSIDVPNEKGDGKTSHRFDLTVHQADFFKPFEEGKIQTRLP